jgi:hypothetical protein
MIGNTLNPKNNVVWVFTPVPNKNIFSEFADAESDMMRVK